MTILQLIALLLLAAAVLLTLARLVAGPTMLDRLVAADTAAVITTAALAWLASGLGQAFYLDIALVYGALAFMVVVAVARTVEDAP